MSKVIDLELDLPPSVEQIVSYMKDTVLRRSEKGLAGCSGKSATLVVAPD